jgi:hypothetical protein
MAVRQDKIQFILEFLNEESQSLSRHVVDAKKLNDEIKKLGTEEAKLKKQFDEATAAGKSTLDIEQKRMQVQAEINERLTAVLKTGKGIEELDLSKVVPAQLVSTAKELAKAMEFIPQSHPTYAKLETALKKVNDQMATNRLATKGMATAMDETAIKGNKLSHVLEIAFGVSLAGLAERFVEKIKEMGVELYNRSTELENFERKNKIVFGNATKDIEAFAARMSLQVGQSTADVIGDLNDISNSFTTLEFNKKDIAGLTKQLYELSAQWAQYNGGKYTALEVSEKFKKALGGEVDELAELGIVLTQDTLKKEMSKKGYDKLIGASFDQASALTLLNIITKKTTEAQTNFGNNAETMAAKQHKVTTFLKNMWDDAARNLTVFFSNITGAFAGVADHFTRPAKTIVDSTKEMQYAFNKDIEVIQKSNVSVEQRKELIIALNGEYKQYLPNLVSETASNSELNRIRDEGNKLFEKHIFYLAYKIKLDEINAKMTGATKTILDAEIRETSANYDRAQRKFGDDGQKFYENQRNIANVTRALGKQQLEEGQKELSMFNTAAEKTAKDMKTTFSELNKLFGETDHNYAAGVDFKKEYDPSVQKKAMELELKGIQAAMERKLVFLEKDKLQGVVNEEQYEEQLFQIRQNGLERELAVYRKYNEGQSLEAAKVEKELVEAEKHKATAIMKAKIEAAESMATAMRAMAENKFLGDTEGSSKSEYEEKERAYRKRLLQIDLQFSEAKMKILRDSHQHESAEYIKEENKILKIKSDARAIDQAQLDANAAYELKVQEAISKEKSKVIQDKISELEIANTTEEGVMEIKFAKLLMTEQEFAMQKLEFKRAMIADEIRLLQLGGEHEIKEARRKAEELAKIDQDIELQKIKNQKIQERLITRNLEISKDALSLGADLFTNAMDKEKAKNKEKIDGITARMEALKKEGKEASQEYKDLQKTREKIDKEDLEQREQYGEAIKAFQTGQVVVNGIIEIQKIWASVAEYGVAAPVVGSLLTAFAIARSAVAIDKIQNQKFAEGGFTPSTLGGRADETGHEPVGYVHADEWVAPKKMVKANPQLFGQLDQMRLRGYADGGIVGLNVTPNPNLVIPNYAYLSANGQLYGQTNGAQNAQGNGQSAFNQSDERLLQAILNMNAKMDSWQKSLKTDFSYTDFKRFEDRINSDIKAGSL